MTENRTALIVGLGRFGGGRAAAAFLDRLGYRLRVVDQASREALADSCATLEACCSQPIDWRLEEAATLDGTEALLDGVELCVINPAVRPDHPLLAAARLRRVALTQEVNLFLEHYPGEVVFVTGTNGKSTTATLLARCLEHAGQDVLLGGNIGRSLLDPSAVRRWTTGQTAILEISSAQLSRIDPLRHRVAGAVLTRITSDHLDWHGSLQAYRSAKSRALAAADRFVVHHGEDETASALAPTAPRRLRYSSHPPAHDAVGVEQGWIVSRFVDDPGAVLHVDASHLVGAFHAENLAAAFAAATACGVDRATCGIALAQVHPLPHRLQLLRTVGKRRIYGNAVSTEIGSTASALDAIEGPVRWVGGGKSKTGEFDSTAQAVAPRVASAHIFGAAAAPLGALLTGKIDCTQSQTLEDALDAAWQAAAPGDAILFSPAFASFDQYVNFRARAAAFEEWVGRLRDPEPAAGSPAKIPRAAQPRRSPPPSARALDAEL